MVTKAKLNLVDSTLKIADNLFRLLLPSIPQDLVSLDVTMPQAKIMLALYVQGPQRMSDIAGELNVALPTATSFIERLVDKNYVVRDTHPEDRRVVMIRLSEAGHKAISGIWESSRQRLKELLAAMDTGKLQMLLEALESLLKSTQETSQAAAARMSQISGKKC